MHHGNFNSLGLRLPSSFNSCSSIHALQHPCLNLNAPHVAIQCCNIEANCNRSDKFLSKSYNILTINLQLFFAKQRV